ncbi:6808_t:CDS:1 [Funneliformis mosseae]|uniref:6808_t:CDS:1 n=1 Tax=Funneliformis mosseae TaxID=27381 RepID=A0A9N8ZYR4_FUNMO|nr:6808_t:CDS:1 [Funneliformis mosseae]
MATKYVKLPTNNNNVLPTTTPQRQPSSSFLSNIRKYVYLLILITFFALFAFSDELSSIFILDNPETCDKMISGGCVTFVENSEKFIPLPKDEEKYMTYIPHSGFHNQRIALENAVYLAWYLNRTLILPPIILGNRFGWRDYDKLLKLISSLKSNKSNVEEECKKDFRPKRCVEFHKSYMLTTWKDLFNMTFIENHVRVIYNHNVNLTHIIKDQLKIDDEVNDVIYDKLYPGYHNFFEYSVPPEKVAPIADGRILKYYILDEFKKQPQKLVVFGSLFGPGTVIRQSTTSQNFYHDTQLSIIPNNEIMTNAAKRISDRMGSTFNYITFHGRAGDGDYKLLAHERIAMVISNLKRDMPDFDSVDMNQYRNLSESEKHNLCFENLTLPEDKTTFSRFTRIYLASDIDKTAEPLQAVFETFPCVYMMSDFKEELEPLHQIINSVDNQQMYKYVVPFVDLMTGSNGRRLYTMGRSTFAGYMLRYHRLIEKKHKSSLNVI